MADNMNLAVDSRTGVHQVIRRGRESKSYNEFSLTDDQAFNLGPSTGDAIGVYVISWTASGVENTAIVSNGGTSCKLVASTESTPTAANTFGFTQKFAVADTDNYLCLYVSSGRLYFKNRTGGTITARMYRLT